MDLCQLVFRGLIATLHAHDLGSHPRDACFNPCVGFNHSTAIHPWGLYEIPPGLEQEDIRLQGRRVCEPFCSCRLPSLCDAMRRAIETHWLDQ